MKDRSEVLEHFTKEETATGLRAVCKYCNMKYNCDPKRNGTSPLRLIYLNALSIPLTLQKILSKVCFLFKMLRNKMETVA